MREKKDTREEVKNVKKVRCDILKAFAMMGALAWQATIIKIGFACWVGDRTGSCFPSLGSPTFCVPVPYSCWHLVLRFITACCKLNGATAQHKLQHNARSTLPYEDLLLSTHMNIQLQCLHGGY